jgi:hypothetical protein
METWKGASAIGLAAAPAETDSLIWPPTKSDGPTVWVANEPLSDAPVPERSRLEERSDSHGPEPVSRFDVPVTIEIASFQSVADLWELDTTPDPIPRPVRGGGKENAPTAETAPVPMAFDISRRKGARRNYGPWVMAAAVSTVIAIGGLWTRHEKRLGMESMAIASSRKSTEGPPQNGANIRAEGPPLVSLPVLSDRRATAAPVPHTVEEIPPASRAEIRVAPPHLGRIREAAVPAALHPSVGATTTRPSTPATFSPRPDTSAVPAANVASVTVAPSPLPATAAPTLAVQPSYGSRPTGPDPTVIHPQPQIDDRLLVNQTLQRYRAAYDELDAHSAQAVWPSVNQAALARAFDALESQTLSFDTCEIQLQTRGTATATCRGSARYVPKIGNRDPHTESRVWSFDLLKEGAGWTIDRARVAR